MIRHIDSGHSWYEVNRTELERLDIEDKISGFSYQKGSKVYLEEDCDIVTYLQARFGDIKSADCREFFENIQNEYYRHDAPMRSYRSYCRDQCKGGDEVLVGRFI